MSGCASTAGVPSARRWCGSRAPRSARKSERWRLHGAALRSCIAPRGRAFQGRRRDPWWPHEARDRSSYRGHVQGQGRVAGPSRAGARPPRRRCGLAAGAGHATGRLSLLCRPEMVPGQKLAPDGLRRSARHLFGAWRGRRLPRLPRTQQEQHGQLATHQRPSARERCARGALGHAPEMDTLETGLTLRA